MILDIINEKGLHARASAKFVEVCEHYDATAMVSKDGETANGDSIMGLLMLAASKGTQIDVTVEGPESEQLMSALNALVTNYFGEGR